MNEKYSYLNDFLLTVDTNIKSTDFGKSFSSWLNRTKSNKISPLTQQDFDIPTKTKKEKKQSDSSVTTKQPPTVNSFLSKYFLKKPSFLFIPSSWLSVGTNKPVDVCVFLKSPYVVAGSELQGTLSIKCHHSSSIEEFIHTVSHIKVMFSGVEAINNTSKSKDQFISLPVIELCESSEVLTFHTGTGSTETRHLAIPFSIPLPIDLTGTFISKKGSITYQIKSDIEYLKQSGTPGSIISTESIMVFANYAFNDLAHLNSPIVCSGTYKSVDMKINLPQSIWVAGEPFFFTAKIHDTSDNNTICGMKAQILRTQCFYSTKDLTKVAHSSVKVVSQTSFSDEAWLKSLNPVFSDFVSVAMNIPNNESTIVNRKLIHVTYSLEILISCSKKNSLETIIKVPIAILHPISISSLAEKHTTKPPTLLKRLRSMTSYGNTGTSIKSGYSTESSFSTVLSVSTSQSSHPTLKKSMSAWSALFSMFLSPSSSSNSLKTSSPVTTIQDHTQTVPTKSIIRFGCVPGPKKYGQNPGSLQDASISIQNNCEIVINSHAA